jgi:hypothetical protein
LRCGTEVLDLPAPGVEARVVECVDRCLAEVREAVDGAFRDADCGADARAAREQDGRAFALVVVGAVGPLDADLVARFGREPRRLLEGQCVGIQPPVCTSRTATAVSSIAGVRVRDSDELASGRQ